MAEPLALQDGKLRVGRTRGKLGLERSDERAYVVKLILPRRCEDGKSQRRRSAGMYAE